MKSDFRVLLLFLFLFPVGVAHAQETVIPFCSGTEAIDATVGPQLKRFQQYKGFLQATLVMQADSGLAADVLYKPEAVIRKERILLSAAERDALCEEVLRAKARFVPEPEPQNQEGRKELISSSVAYTLFYYGWAVPVALQAEDGEVYAASYLLLGGASFFIPFFGTSKQNVTKGMARGYSAGSGLGIGHGWALSAALLGDEWDGRAGLGLSVATSITEGLIGYNYAKKKNLGLGHMSMMSNGGLWGGLYGLSMPYFFDSRNSRVYGTTTLLGSGAGTLLANRLGRKHNFAEGDGRVVSTTGWLGVLLGAAAISTLSDGKMSGQAGVGLMVAGSALGLKLGLGKAIRHDYSQSDGSLIMLGSMAGALVGFGITYLAAPNGSSSPYLWAGTLGGTGGFLLTERLIRKSSSSRQIGSLQMELNPMALRGALRQPDTQRSMQPLQPQPQLLRMSYHF